MNFPKEVEGCGERIDLQVLHQSSHSLAFGKVTSFGYHFDGVLIKPHVLYIALQFQQDFGHH